MSDAPGDNKPKPIFNPDDAEPSAAPLIDFGADTKADATAEAARRKPRPRARRPTRRRKPPKAEAKADEAAAKAAKADKAAAKADAKAAKTSGTATGEVAPAGDSEFAGREVVYVQAPVPPRLKGNRGIGSLLAVLGAAVFACHLRRRRDSSPSSSGDTGTVAPRSPTSSRAPRSGSRSWSSWSRSCCWCCS